MISSEEVKHIAELARIGTKEDERATYSKEVSAILDWMKELQEVDTEGVETANHITGRKNVSREDKGGVFGDEEKLRNLFPERKDSYDKVKSVL